MHRRIISCCTPTMGREPTVMCVCFHLYSSLLGRVSQGPVRLCRQVFIFSSDKLTWAVGGRNWQVQLSKQHRIPRWDRIEEPGKPRGTRISRLHCRPSSNFEHCNATYSHTREKMQSALFVDPVVVRWGGCTPVSDMAKGRELPILQRQNDARLDSWELTLRSLHVTWTSLGRVGWGLQHLPCPGMRPCPTCEREPNKGLTGIECEYVVSVAVRILTNFRFIGLLDREVRIRNIGQQTGCYDWHCKDLGPCSPIPE
jgi:hypothetical protein